MVGKPDQDQDRGQDRSRGRWWLLPALVLLGWLVLGGATGPFAGLLSEVQENENSAFLPSDAESTRVSELQTDFVGDDALPAVLVWEAPDGAQVTPELQASAREGLAALADVDDLGEPVGPFPSDDGQALQAVVDITGDIAGPELSGVVEEIRAAVDVDAAAADDVDGAVPGGEVYVTGPAGIFGDFGEAFGEIDGLLLAVALAVVLVILLVVYRSPVLPFIPILTAVFSLGVASAIVYVLASDDVLDLNGQSQGILFILVVGAATDYSLLLVARYREELRRHAHRYEAMRVAWRRTLEPVLASGGTVVLGVLCLLASSLSSTRGLGPVSAIGVAVAVVATLTFLPAVLVLLGRWAYWPFRPQLGEPGETQKGPWAAVARLVARRPAAVLLATLVPLLIASGFATQLPTGGVANDDIFTTEVESATGQDVLEEHFPGGAGTPLLVVAPQGTGDDVTGVLQADDDVAQVVPTTTDPRDPSSAPVVVDAGGDLGPAVQLQATLATPPGQESSAAVERLRGDLDRADLAALVGGAPAVDADIQEASARDLQVIVPLVLLVIFVVLALLLRALLAPLLLIGTVVLSFAATLGVGALVFTQVLDLPGGDPSIPLFAFVFLGALGIDYNIFLMTRVREETERRGTRAGTLVGLAVTGGVITSAGIVLAATFGALAVLPILFLLQIAFLVAFGVLLDTFVVRGLLVPAATYLLGGRTWWPSGLRRREEEHDDPSEVLRRDDEALAA